MPVLLRHSGDLPEPTAYDAWFPVTGAGGRGPEDKKLPKLAHKLDAAFSDICAEWWEVSATLAHAPGAELAYATTCSSYASDFGLMMAWARLTEIAARESSPYLVVCDDPWLFRHLAALPRVEAGTAPPLAPAVMALRLRGFLARTRLIARLVHSWLATRHQRLTLDPGDPVILVYGHPDSDANGHDAYFADLMERLAGVKRLLHTDCPPGRASRLAADGRTASLHAWGNPWLTPALLFVRWRPLREHRQGSYGWLVRRAAEKEGGGAAHAMNRWQHICQDAWLAQARPAAVAWPWENHGWERALCRKARQSGVPTVGYQHTVIGPHQLNYSPATNIDGVASLPDRVACVGPAYRDQLAAWGVPAERLIIAGSLRIGRNESDPYDAQGPVFVALSARRSTARHQLRAVEAAAEQGHRFLVKEHPMYPLDFRETDRVRRTDGTIGEQRSLSAVVYSTGTSGLEALLAGLPTFRLLPEDDIAIAILPPFVSVQPVVAEDLADALAAARKPAALSRDRVLAHVDMEIWRRLLMAGGEEMSGVARKQAAGVSPRLREGMG